MDSRNFEAKYIKYNLFINFYKKNNENAINFILSNNNNSYEFSGRISTICIDID
jgi:hypothetical protein